MASVDEAVSQHVPTYSMLGKDEVFYMNPFDLSRKKEVCNCSKL
jgi:hypothetical protein